MKDRSQDRLKIDNIRKPNSPVGEYSSELVSRKRGFHMMIGAPKSLTYYFYGKMPEKPREAICALKFAAEQRGA